MKGISNLEIRSKIILCVFDIVLIILAFTASQKLSTLQNKLSYTASFEAWDSINIMPALIVFPLLIYVFELYKPERWQQNLRLIILISIAVICGSCLMAVLAFLFPNWLTLDRNTLIIHVLLSILSLYFLRKFAIRRASITDHKNNIILIGNHKLLNEIYGLLSDKYTENNSFIKWVKPCYETPDHCLLYEPETGEKLSSLIKNNHISTLVLSDDLVTIPEFNELLPAIRQSGARLYDPLNYYEVLTNKVAVQHIEHSWFLFHNQGVSFNPRIYLKIKKVVETASSLLLLIGFAPLFIFVSLCVWGVDGRPVLYHQERMGRKGELFTLYKFRTMRNSSTPMFVPAWKMTEKKQNEITALGKILRKTRLDELPQLFNVLKGDMSFIGPRPIRPNAAQLLQTDIPFYSWRFSVTPGLTGWAQVSAGYGDSLDGQIEKLQYDLYYIQNQSVVLDLLIVIKTIRSLLFLRGK